MNAEVMSLMDTYHCPVKRCTMLLENCLDDYVNAAAYENRRSICFGCREGRKTRERFASSANPSFNILFYLREAER
ncbi:MAG: hypothetical protein AAB575_05975 [Patescibacteria group bacterium]